VVIVLHAEPPAHDPVLGDLPVEHNLDHDVDADPRLLEGFVQFLGLGEVSGKPVQEPALLAVRLLQAVQDHRNGDAVRHQLSPVDVPFGLLAEGRSPGDVVPEDDAGFNVGYAVLALHDGTLCALPLPFGPKKSRFIVLSLYGIVCCSTNYDESVRLCSLARTPSTPRKYHSIFNFANFDGPVKSRNLAFSVIPVKTGIHEYQAVMDSRLRGVTPSETFYGTINFAALREILTLCRQL